MTDGFEAPNLRQIAPTDEDEYFAREDRERIAQLKAERRKREETHSAEALREVHWMHCPKCGQKLEELTREGLLIDQCAHCHGVWLDASEFQAMVAKCEAGLAQRLFGWRKA